MFLSGDPSMDWTGLRVYKELAPMKKEDVDLANALVWIPDSKTASGIAEVPLTELAVEAFQRQIAIVDRVRTPVAIGPALRRSGRRRFGRPSSRIFGTTTFGRPTPPASAPGGR